MSTAQLLYRRQRHRRISGDGIRAEASYRELANLDGGTLESCEHRFGLRHSSTLEAVQELVKNLLDVRFYDEAEANMRRVLLSYEAMAGVNYVKTTEAFEILAAIRANSTT
ncbi:hypothetical protein GGR53DRAFT_466363 [Hypoxylon sp. FL1150]|nr:hypothetical protein GGR53DRAFT_466363 [Hypoxylon sp. FL1150]